MKAEALLIGGPDHLKRLPMKDRKIQRFEVASYDPVSFKKPPIDVSETLEEREIEAMRVAG